MYSRIPTNNATYPIIAVVGLTASGKTELSLDLCEYLRDCVKKNGWAEFEPEIICADAYQLYRGMDIGTAKIPSSERRGIPHHQLDVLDITETASVAVYQEKARADVLEIYRRGHVPVIVGGSGLYVRALLDQIQFPGTCPEKRAELQQRLKEVGPNLMHQWLAKVDPPSADWIKPEDTRRVIRALEVTLAFGTPFSYTLPKAEYWYPTLQFALQMPMEKLDERIDLRSQLMFQQGFLREVQKLMEVGLADTPTASRATGYLPAIKHLQGEITESEALDLLSQDTRRLARKQRKWFRRDRRINWLDSQLCRREQLQEIESQLVDFLKGVASEPT